MPNVGHVSFFIELLFPGTAEGEAPSRGMRATTRTLTICTGSVSARWPEVRSCSRAKISAIAVIGVLGVGSRIVNSND